MHLKKSIVFPIPTIKAALLQSGTVLTAQSTRTTEISMWSLLKLNGSQLRVYVVYSNPKGDCDLNEVKEQKLLSDPKNSNFPQSNWEEKKQQNCQYLFKNTDTVTYNLPIALAVQTLTKVQPKQTDMVIKLAKQSAQTLCLNLEPKFELHRLSKEATPLIIYVSYTVRI